MRVVEHVARGVHVPGVPVRVFRGGGKRPRQTLRRVRARTVLARAGGTPLHLTALAGETSRVPALRLGGRRAPAPARAHVARLLRLRRFFRCVGGMSVIGKRGGECAYCHRTFRRLTKEHVVPHCVGGTLTIRVCPDCNNRRQTSLVDPLFVMWRMNHPDLFQEAVETSTDPVQTRRWLQSAK